MSMYYTHMLIPDQVDYAPCSSHVADFFAALINIGAAPVNAELEAQYFKLPYRKRKGWKAEFRRGTNPLTGEPIALPRYIAKFQDEAELREALRVLRGVDQYEASIFGSWPPKLSPLPLGTHDGCRFVPYNGQSELSVCCCLHPEIASTSSPFDAYPTSYSLTDRTGFFRNPRTGETIRVPNAGYARFWIEFRFGKWLFPEMKDNGLDLLSIPVVDAAYKAFSTRFNQGCSWG
jgi:hypothetical protein